MNEKYFDYRNERKKLINSYAEKIFYPQEGEIWNTTMGINIGNEQNGGIEFRRPLLVLKKIGNLYFGLALTTKGKNTSWYYSLINPIMINKKDKRSDSKVCLGQAKMLDKKRFIKKLGRISFQDLTIIKKMIKELYL